MTKHIQKKIIPKKKQLNIDDYVEGVKCNNRTLLGKALTLIESTKSAHQELSESIIEQCLPFSGNSIRIGVTGVPGVGKSTFIEALGMYLIKKYNKKVAVLAIDPSSKASGGSILGDKTRMNDLSTNNSAFVRPSPSSGTLGGVARATRESIILCEAAGYDIIFVETVGVGQSEIEVKSMVDFFLLLMLAGAGDELQGIKRGIMEMADALVINKADGDNLILAKKAKQSYQNALHLFPKKESNWKTQTAVCSSIDKTGIADVWKIIDEFNHHIKKNNWLAINRKKQAKYWLNSTLNRFIFDLFKSNQHIKDTLPIIEQQVVDGHVSPFKAAKILIELFKTKNDKN